ncbi:MAG: Ig-like domain-containing protein [Bacteroidales bacterium]
MQKTPNINLFQYLLWTFLLGSIYLIFTQSCARIASPQGGPNDSTPPILLRTKPENGVLNFNKKKILITFNEYVQLKDFDKHFLMSPPPERRPTVVTKGKGVQVSFNALLFDSTTYLLDFGNAIADNNEGNLFPNYRFAFSTGDELDTLALGGKVLDAFSDKALPNTLVYLYDSLQDSVVLNQRPFRTTRTNTEGEFILHNLKKKPYKIIALNDANGDYKYDIGSEGIAFFAHTPIPTQPHHDGCCEHHDEDTTALHHNDETQVQLVLRMFTELPRNPQMLISSTRPEQRAINLIFNATYPRIDSLTFNGEPQTFLLEKSLKYDTLTFWLSDTSQIIADTILMEFSYLKTDTAGELSPFREKQELIFTTPKVEEEKKEKEGGVGGFLGKLFNAEEEVIDTTQKKPVHWTLTPKFNNTRISPESSPTLQFSSPLVGIDMTQIVIEEQRINLRSKDTTFIPVKFALQKDSLQIRRYVVEAAWKENTLYRYSFFPEAFVDIYQQTTDTIDGIFTSVNPDDLSVIFIDFANVTGQYIIQLTDVESKKLFQEKLVAKNKKLEIPYITPGNYSIRIIKDDNANGKWDTGNYFKQIQPEYAVFLKNSDENFEFSLKMGWELELKVDLKTIFPEE